MREVLSSAAQLVVDDLQPVWDLVEDPATTDVLLNADGSVQVCGLEGLRTCKRQVIEDDRMRLVLAAASASGLNVESSRRLETTLPIKNLRFAAVLAPVGEATAIALRKPAETTLTLEDLVRFGALDQDLADRLIDASASGSNLVVSGVTGGGKTTMARALMVAACERDPEQRIVTIEIGSRELQFPGLRVESWTVETIAEASAQLRIALRFFPQRILLGEVRGQEAAVLLEAWESGHQGGATTIHAASPNGALRRLERLARGDHEQSRMDLILDVVDLVVQVGFVKGRRCVTTVAEVKENGVTTWWAR